MLAPSGLKSKVFNTVRYYDLYPLGEQAVVVRLSGGISDQTLRLVSMAAKRLEQHRPPEVTELVQAYRTVTVYYDPVQIYAKSNRGGPGEPGKGGADWIGKTDRSPYESMCLWIRECFNDPDLELSAVGERNGTESNGTCDGMETVTTVPACFGGSFGPDLDEVAALAGLSAAEAVELYCSVTYRVHMIGFAPGFPYLGGLPERLAAPRRARPRLEVPAGSIGIAGSQTGIYPLATPGGWQLIGRTSLKLFQQEQSRPSLLQAGDLIRFVPTPKESLC
jgi:inhibitor of KinA